MKRCSKDAREMKIRITVDVLSHLLQWLKF